MKLKTIYNRLDLSNFNKFYHIMYPQFSDGQEFGAVGTYGTISSLLEDSNWDNLRKAIDEFPNEISCLTICYQSESHPSFGLLESSGTGGGSRFQ